MKLMYLFLDDVMNNTECCLFVIFGHWTPRESTYRTLLLKHTVWQLEVSKRYVMTLLIHKAVYTRRELETDSLVKICDSLLLHLLNQVGNHVKKK